MNKHPIGQCNETNIFILSGYETHRIVSKPGKITIEEAMQSVGRGLAQMKKAQLEENNNKPFKTGLILSEVEMTFNVIASAEEGGKTGIQKIT